MTISNSRPAPEIPNVIDWATLWRRYCDADAKHSAVCEREELIMERTDTELLAAGEVGEAIDSIVETPSDTVAGIAVELALLRRYEGFCSGWIDDLTQSALDDAERISGLVLSSEEENTDAAAQPLGV